MTKIEKQSLQLGKKIVKRYFSTFKVRTNLLHMTARTHDPTKIAKILRDGFKIAKKYNTEIIVDINTY